MSHATTAYPPHVNGSGPLQSSFSPPSVSSRFASSTYDRTQMAGFDRTMSAPTVPGQHDNIMNRKAGVNSSLYQSCLALKKRLAEVPDFEPHLEEMDQEEHDSGDTTDPVTSMWQMLRQGYPLMTIYNALQPKVLLELSNSKVPEAKLGKAATFKFLQACLEELKFPPNECFLITDLYGQDTTGFVKVLKVVNRVLDILSENGLLLQTEESLFNDGATDTQPRSHQQKIIDELVTTERDYVQHLETLQQFKNQLEQTGAIPGDVVHDIFLNLNALLDFQRRFLIRIEQQNSLEPALQNWGLLFVQYQEAFRVYEPFIANQQRCNEIVTREWDKIRAAPLSPSFQGMVESQSVLGSFLMKPFVRLTKYPMLLKELKKRANLDEQKIQDLEAGAEATSAILERANQILDKESRLAAVEDLQSRVDDWKGHQIDRFGELVVCGTHTVLKGESPKEVEREYKIYLFERILLCCKEVNPNKAKNRLGKNVDKKGKPRLQLKGRIFMQNVTDILSYSKSGTYFLQIFWKGDPAVEHFVIRFPMEETRNKWKEQVEKQKRALDPPQRISGQTVTSDRNFYYLESQAILQNPHEQEDNGEDEDENRLVSEGSANGAVGQYSIYRVPSDTSLHSRPTTGGSGPPPSQLPSRAAPLRFPIPDHVHGPNGPPLTISTNISNPGTPNERQFSSYFSPTAESPPSIHSGSNAGMYPFPLQPLPASIRWTTDENKHITAPPSLVKISKTKTLANVYALNGQIVQRPSLPAMTGTENAAQLFRLRSTSSPNIQNPDNYEQRRYANGQIQPALENIPVPPIPTHMVSMKRPESRTQTGSPTEIQRRGVGQSPKSARDRAAPQYSTTHGYDQSQQLYQSDPRYSSGQTAGASSMSGIGERMMSPPLQPAANTKDRACPTQLKVKIWFEPPPSHVTIVVHINIKHRSLIDRIDSKMEKVTEASIAKGTARLQYRDADHDLITIGCDEDVVTAIEEWTEINREIICENVFPDFELFWIEISPQ